MGSKTDKLLAQSVLDQFAADDKKSRIKNKTQRIDGQILRIPEEVYKGTFKPIFPEIKETQIDKIFNSYIETILKELQVPFLASLSKDEREFYIGLIHEYKKVSPGMEVFIIRKFRDLNEGWKGFRGGRKQVLARIVEKHYRAPTEAENDMLSGKDNKHGTQLGHADEGVGLAISQIRVARAKAQIAAKNSPRLEKLIKAYEKRTKVTINHELVVDSAGNFLKTYTPVITVQSSLYNQEQGREDEKSAFNALERSINAVILDPGSTSLPEAITQVTLFNLVGKTSNKIKSTGIKKKTVKERSTGTKKARTKTKQETRVITERKPDTIALSKSKGKKEAKRSVSPFSYLAMINKKLPQTVRKNMGAPALENRSGAFASSVKLQDVNTTPQGHPSFGYTYDKNPYQVFEVGTGSAPWATSQRDPRKLIDRSIREVAAELAIGRFYTRRL